MKIVRHCDGFSLARVTRSPPALVVFDCQEFESGELVRRQWCRGGQRWSLAECGFRKLDRASAFNENGRGEDEFCGHLGAAPTIPFTRGLCRPSDTTEISGMNELKTSQGCRLLMD